MSCEHDCDKPPIFPKLISNRPGLPAIDYRVGAFAELRDYMLDAINKEPALFNWTHRGVDDPGIALIESAAIVGDILTFYQNLYANEAYLRTAQWRESITELVRLLGYRVTPAIGGEVTFALTVKGKDSVTVPKGFGFKAQLEGQSKPAEFESTQEIVAYPQLSEFHLYRPRHTPYSTNGTQTFYVFSPDGIPEGLKLKEGDRVLVGQPNPTNPTRLAHQQVLIVEKSWESFGMLQVKFKTPLKWSGSTFELTAYKLGESYHHFGHNAPSIYFKLIGTTPTPTPTPTPTATATWYSRDDWEGDQTSLYYTMNFSTLQVEMPLDRETKDIVAGNWVLVQAIIATRYPSSSWLNQPYTLVGKVASVANQTLNFAGVSGASTVLTFEQNLLTLIGDNVNYYDAFRMDIRSVNFHQVQGEPFLLRAAKEPDTSVSGNNLYYYGTDTEAKALLGRPLLLVGADETKTNSANDVQSLAPAYAERKLFRRVTLAQSVTYADFDLAIPATQVYGNLVPTTQGKTEDQVVLGNGDQRQTFQTFAIPKTPLTYLLDETQTPAQVPELTIYIDGTEWQRVDTFFNSGPNDKVYVVRNDADGKSYVQFGDGITGARLSSGKNNVVASFRTGSEAYGPLKTNTKVQAKGRLANLDKVFMPAPVTGGAAAENENNTRVAAPGKIQSLGRLVSLADFETEALAIPNVIKVKAGWAIPEGLPLVRLVILTQSGDAADTVAINDTMRTYNICRGPARFPIQVIQGVRQFVHLNITAGFEAVRREEDMIIAIKLALGLTGEEGNGIDNKSGLFGLNHRQFGQGVHSSQIIAAVQQVPGIVWAELNKDQLISLGTPPEADPTALPIPGSPTFNDVLPCDEDRILVLHSMHFIVSLSKVETPQACDA